MNKLIVILLLAILITLLDAWIIASVLLVGLIALFFLIGLVLHCLDKGRETYSGLSFIKAIKRKTAIDKLKRKIKMKEELGYNTDNLIAELESLEKQKR